MNLDEFDTIERERDWALTALGALLLTLIFSVAVAVVCR